MTTRAAAPNVNILLDGTPVPAADFISYVVERDMFQPDMASIVLTNQNDIYSPKIKIGASIEIKVGDGEGTSIYKGDLVGAEGTFKGGQTTRLLLRSMNKMHRLLRMRKSLTFTEKTDQQILSQVAQDAKLNLEWKHDKSITYKHVYQHNLTDLEFIRTRAARMGCHVWCEDTKLYVKEPELDQASGISLSVDQKANLRSFTPRISSASVVKKVTVKGWNPETKELITGEASAQNSPLGSQNAVAACGDLGKEETFTVDHPIWSKEEADALAKARLRDLNLTFITGEAEIEGDPNVKLGKTVEIEANAMDSADPFNGKYYVSGITHRHTLPKSKEGGYVTIIKFMRDAWKK
jgi:phage protein D